MKALLGLLKKEGYHILRDRRTLAVLILLPIVQVILFGFAIRTDVTDVHLAVVDPSPDDATLAIRARLSATQVFTTVAVVPRVSDLDRLFQTDVAQVAVVFAPGLSEALARGLPAQVQIITDATEPNTGTARASYVKAVIQSYDAERQAASPAGAHPPGGTSGAGGAPPIQIVPQMRMRFNETEESSNLFVPGLMAMVLTIISALMTALSLTREKETGTMEALLVSPLRPWQIIVGKVAPYLLIGFVSVVAVLVEARLVFHVPMVGSVTLLLAEGVLFTLVSLALGILISARTSSQRVAMMGALVGTMLPTQLLSGFIFPIESLPKVLQWVSYIVPARWFVLIARGIMLKGIGLSYLWPDTLILAGMALVLLTLSARSFNVRLE